MGEILIKRKSLKACVAQKGGRGKLLNNTSLKASDAKKEGGGLVNLKKTKALKAWVAKKGGGENFSEKQKH